MADLNVLRRLKLSSLLIAMAVGQLLAFQDYCPLEFPSRRRVFDNRPHFLLPLPARWLERESDKTNDIMQKQIYLNQLN